MPVLRINSQKFAHGDAKASKNPKHRASQSSTNVKYKALISHFSGGDHDTKSIILKNIEKSDKVRKFLSKLLPRSATSALNYSKPKITSCSNVEVAHSSTRTEDVQVKDKGQTQDGEDAINVACDNQCENRSSSENSHVALSSGSKRFINVPRTRRISNHEDGDEFWRKRILIGARCRVGDLHQGDDSCSDERWKRLQLKEVLDLVSAADDDHDHVDHRPSIHR